MCKLPFCLLFGIAVPLNAQDDTVATAQPIELQDDEEAEEAEEPVRIDLSVTVPRGEIDESRVRACETEADAASISGEIIVCRELEQDNSFFFSGSRDAARKRIAEETAYSADPRAPIFIPGCKDQGNPPGCISGIGSVPPPALIIDVEALPEAPPGSDADRVGRGLAPRGGRELTEEEEKARREALGLETPD